jgi:hypothetical protein
MGKQFWGILALSVLMYLYLASKKAEVHFHDFSGLGEKVPANFRLVTCENDLIKVLKGDNRLSMQGAGHSMNGVSVTDDFQLVNKNKEIILWESDTLLTVSSGFTVQEVEYIARKKGQHIPCLQDKGIFSIGGTHAVGGIGWESIQWGTQNHHVEKLELILPNGTKAVASETNNSDLFRYTLAGVGQTGYISSITLRTMPYQKYHSIATYAFQTFKEAFHFIEKERLDEKSAKGEIELFHGGKHKLFNKLYLWLGKKFDTEGDAHSWRPPTDAQPLKLSVGQDWIGHNISLSNVSAYHLWTDYVFPSALKAEKFIEEVFGSTALEEPISGFHNSSSNIGFLAIYLLKPQSGFIPLSILQNSTSISISIGFYHSFSSNGDALEIKDQKRIHLGKAIDNQGRPYNYGYNPLTEKQAINVYGEETMQKYHSLRKELDPLNRWIKSNYSALTMPL